jgi:hypothetical protein
MTIEHMAKQIEEALAVLVPAGKRVPADRQSSEAQAKPQDPPAAIAKAAQRNPAV